MSARKVGPSRRTDRDVCLGFLILREAICSCRAGSEVLGSPDCWAGSIMIVTEIEVHEFHPEYLEWLHHALFHYYGETTRTVFVPT